MTLLNILLKYLLFKIYLNRSLVANMFNGLLIISSLLLIIRPGYRLMKHQSNENEEIDRYLIFAIIALYD